MFQSFDGILLGEKGLWVFVLRRAVHDYAQYRNVADRRFEWQTAAWWIFGVSEDGVEATPEFEAADGDEPGSLAFDEVCGLMGWDPDAIRSLAKRLTKEDVKKFELEQFMDLLDERTKIEFGTPRWSSRDGASALPLTPLHYSPEVVQSLRLQPVAPTPSPELVSCVSLGWT